MIRALILSATLICAPAASFSQAALTRLYDLIAIDAYIGIVREEGLEDIDTLSEDMLGRPADAALLTKMSRIYDPLRMGDAVRRALQREMTDTQVEQAAAFFSSARMQRIIELEVAARRAISDPSVEDIATVAWLEAEEERPWLVARINEIWRANDLLERNVAGALNANLHFYRGLAQSDAFAMSETEMLSEVWAQETEIRAETELWLGAYLTLSYDPVDQDTLESYARFWDTGTGQAVNRAIFAAFNEIYNEISFATGQVLALSIGTQEL